MLSAAKRALVLAPHTDDGEFGCGGTMARLVGQGVEVRYVAFSIATKSLPAGFAPDTLAREVREATAELGIPDGNLDVHDFEVRTFPVHRQDILELLIGLWEEWKPDAVFQPSLHDVHQDHETIAAEGLRAFKRTTILGYEIPWNNFDFSYGAYLGLERRHVERKVAAVSRYASQQHRRYADEEYIWNLARVHGTSVLTAVTAQNTRAVTAALSLPQRLIRAQIDAVRDDFAIAAWKTGMLADDATVRAMYERFEFKQWLKDIAGTAEAADAPAARPATADTGARRWGGSSDTAIVAPPAPSEIVRETVLDESALARWLESIDKADVTAFEIEGSSLDPMQARIVGIALSVAAGRGAYIPLDHRYTGVPQQLDRARTLASAAGRSSCASTSVDCMSRSVKRRNASSDGGGSSSAANTIRPKSSVHWMFHCRRTVPASMPYWLRAYCRMPSHNCWPVRCFSTLRLPPRARACSSSFSSSSPERSWPNPSFS